MHHKVRVAVFAEGNTIFSNIDNILSNSKQLQYQGKFLNKKYLLPHLKNGNVDVLLVDGKLIFREDKFLKEFKSINEKIKMIGIVNHETEVELDKIFLEEIQGYIITTQTRDTILQAIRVCSLGGIYLTQSMKQRVSDIIGAKYLSINGLHLSPREKQIANLYCEGLTYKEIAHQLKISPETVRTHLRNFHCKFKKTLAEQKEIIKEHKLLKTKRKK